MMSPPIIENETARLASVESLRVLDTPADTAFDELVELAAWTCHVPIAALSLIDTDRQWFKAQVGLPFAETARDVAFCAHTIAEEQTLIIPDAKLDPRFRESPFVTGDAEIRFYAGVSIIVDDDLPVGTLCVLDTRPRSMFADERRALEIIARQAGDRLHALRLEWEAIDALTGAAAPIAARRWLHDQPTDRPRAVVHVDIDGLATINADHGDEAGDHALADTALRLRQTAPAGSLVARIGDDEFAVLLEGASVDDLATSIQALRAALDSGDEPHVDVSMGLATAAPGDSGQDLIAAAAVATSLEKRLRGTR
ncbi:MAG: GGDEF domain-containing protein [Acidimicrobiales bacterium]|nr:MAG: GGDEF domain-containing protein [Acidimicrobiales bacterium]